ncbi:serine protease [Hyphomicrobium sp. NDB2Meth4]|uniref:S1 family peptidase n=1 Tax=Hyphomicrobium sp. NDB2Meth4 TaxID=1892846 RepID=UPI0015698E2C|nr:serine protease [Hyphomicrobium sp. NDB2Meth4]
MHIWERRKRLCGYLLALTFAPLPSAADEGFFVGKQPAAVRAAWNSVYAFVCEGRGGRYVASAFLVGKRENGKRADFYFITAGHAVDDCRQPNRYLTADINQPRFESDGITRAPRPARLGDVRPVQVDDAYDIAVVKVTAPTRTPIGAPLQIGHNCNDALRKEIYAIGFPGVTQRKSLKGMSETKRWSRGKFVGLGRAEFRGAPYTYIASTVDSLPGSSGGPVIDEKGNLIGVIAKGAAAPENGFRYDVDPKNPGDWQTFLVPCQAALRILQQSGLSSAG